jgi:hypothetical protein
MLPCCRYRDCSTCDAKHHGGRGVTVLQADGKKPCGGQAIVLTRGLLHMSGLQAAAITALARDLALGRFCDT